MTQYIGALPILVVDDEPDILFSTSLILKNNFPNPVLTMEDGGKVMALLEEQELAAVVLDLLIPGMTGQELLPQILYNYPHLPVLIMTGSNAVDTAVECMKMGAFDYLVKPVEKSRLLAGLTRALEVRRLRGENHSLKLHLLDGELQQPEIFDRIITRSRKMLAHFSYLESVAGSDLPLIITGETGTGKELFAMAAHDLSKREGKFVAVNIAGLDDLMLSDALFGHRRGAFTGADQGREGLLAEAANGTLLLDEIGDISPASQTKLLRLIQTNEYYPLGSDVAKRSSARIIATTNRDIQKMIDAGEFRRDLYYRLSTHSCNLPPLRERKEDIPILLDHFITAAAEKLNKMKPPCRQEVLRELSAYHFPGNVRELQGMVYDAVSRHKSGSLSAAFFEKAASKGTRSTQLKHHHPPVAEEEMGELLARFPTMAEAEELLISRAMAKAGGNQRVAASFLGISRQALNNRLVRKRGKS
jgi:two-component system, NtrC family, response regulator HydG